MIDTVAFEISGTLKLPNSDDWCLIEKQSRRTQGGDAWETDGWIAQHEITGLRIFGHEHSAIRAEVSVPKVCFGGLNFMEISRDSFGSALEKTRELVRSAVEPNELEPFGAFTRIDLVKQFRVSPIDIINSHLTVRHPSIRKAGVQYFDESIQWHGKDRRLRMYDKLREVKNKHQPGPITRAELQLRSEALRRDFGGCKSQKVEHDSLTFDRAYNVYRRYLTRLEPLPLRRVTSQANFLSMLISEGVKVQGVPVFDVYCRGKSLRHVRRLRKQIAEARPAFWHWSWREQLPESSTKVISVNPTKEEMEEYWGEVKEAS